MNGIPDPRWTWIWWPSALAEAYRRACFAVARLSVEGRSCSNKKTALGAVLNVGCAIAASDAVARRQRDQMAVTQTWMSGADVAVELDVDAIDAKLTDGLVELDLTTVDLEALGLESGLDVTRVGRSRRGDRPRRPDAGW